MKYVSKMNNPIINAVAQAVSDAYYFIIDDERFKMSPHMWNIGYNKDLAEIVYDKFPIIKRFQDLYDMKQNMLYLDFDVKPPAKSFYDNMPHTHGNRDDINSIFFPITFSEGTATAFFDPPEDKIIIREVDIEGGGTYTLKECDWYEPKEVHQMRVPHIMRIGVFHHPIEIIKGHPDNYKRIICNWESNLPFEKLDALLND